MGLIMLNLFDSVNFYFVNIRFYEQVNVVYVYVFSPLFCELIMQNLNIQSKKRKL